MQASRAPTVDPLVVLVSNRAVLLLQDDSLVLSPATILVSPTTGKIVFVFPTVLPAASFDKLGRHMSITVPEFSSRGS